MLGLRKNPTQVGLIQSTQIYNNTKLGFLNLGRAMYKILLGFRFFLCFPILALQGQVFPKNLCFPNFKFLGFPGFFWGILGLCI